MDMLVSLSKYLFNSVKVLEQVMTLYLAEYGAYSSIGVTFMVIHICMQTHVDSISCGSNIFLHINELLELLPFLCRFVFFERLLSMEA